MKKEILLDNLCRLRSDIRICGISIRDKQTDDNYIKALDEVIEIIEQEPLKEIRAEIEQLPTKTRINWDGCCPDIDYPEIEYVDVTKDKLLDIIDKYKAESEE